MHVQEESGNELKNFHHKCFYFHISRNSEWLSLIYTWSEYSQSLERRLVALCDTEHYLRAQTDCVQVTL